MNFSTLKDEKNLTLHDDNSSVVDCSFRTKEDAYRCHVLLTAMHCEKMQGRIHGSQLPSYLQDKNLIVEMNTNFIPQSLPTHVEWKPLEQGMRLSFLSHGVSYSVSDGLPVSPNPGFGSTPSPPYSTLKRFQEQPLKYFTGTTTKVLYLFAPPPPSLMQATAMWCSVPQIVTFEKIAKKGVVFRRECRRWSTHWSPVHHRRDDASEIVARFVGVHDKQVRFLHMSANSGALRPGRPRTVHPDDLRTELAQKRNDVAPPRTEPSLTTQRV